METPSFERLVLGKSANGVEISFDPVNSHAATHFEDTPALLGLVRKIIPSIEVSLPLPSAEVSDEERHIQEVDMGRVVGRSDLVETRSTDEIFYALRKGRDKRIPFVRNRTPVETSLVTLVIKRLGNGSYDLHTAWVGPKVPTVPEDERESPESRDFWGGHALVVGNQEIIPGSETTECPW